MEIYYTGGLRKLSDEKEGYDQDVYGPSLNGLQAVQLEGSSWYEEKTLRSGRSIECHSLLV